MWGQHTTQLERFFVVEIIPFLFFSTFLQVKITPSDPSLDKSWTNTTELIMNNRNPEFNQTLVIEVCITIYKPLVAGAWTERKKMFHGGSFLKLADDNMDIQNPEAQNRELSGF